MNIFDLNDYCLKRILEAAVTTQEQLLIIATVDPRFLTPTKLLFREKFNMNLVNVSNNVIGLLVQGVRDADVGLVKCFGDEIKKLNISIEFDNGCVDKLERLIAAVTENCGNSLIELRIFHHSQSEPSIQYQQGLKITQQFAQKLSTKFQNLRCLNYEDYYPYEKCLTLKDFVQHLPHLTDFTFDGNLSSENIQNFIELNRKLEHFSLKSKSGRIYLNYAFMMFIDTMLPQLKSLELLGFSWNVIDAEKGISSSIQFDNIGMLRLDDETFSALFCPESLKCLQLKNLKILSINTDSWSWSLNQISNLILSNDKLSYIKFAYITKYNSINYFQDLYSDSSDKCFFEFWDLFDNCFWFHVCDGLNIDRFDGIKYTFKNNSWEINCDEYDKIVSLKKLI